MFSPVVKSVKTLLKAGRDVISRGSGNGAQCSRGFSGEVPPALEALRVVYRDANRSMLRKLLNKNLLFLVRDSGRGIV